MKRRVLLLTKKERRIARNEKKRENNADFDGDRRQDVHRGLSRHVIIILLISGARDTKNSDRERVNWSGKLQRDAFLEARASKVPCRASTREEAAPVFLKTNNNRSRKIRSIYYPWILSVTLQISFFVIRKQKIIHFIA